MFKEIKAGGFYHLINHGPCILVTSGKGEKINVASVAWSMPVNDEPPMLAVALAENHYTSELIEQTGEFAVNVPGENLLPALMTCGSISGRKADKFKKAGITPAAGNKIATPHIAECVGFVECKVRETHRLDGVLLVIGNVVYAAAEDSVYDEYWISEKAKTVHHLGGKYFMISGKRISC
jgi:flavin reductase (DIM6/NTAB) family NADH-FMN oxidoreductase RutF